MKERDEAKGSLCWGYFLVALTLVAVVVLGYWVVISQNLKLRDKLAYVESERAADKHVATQLNFTLQACTHQSKMDSVELENLRKVQKKYLEVKAELDDIGKYLIENYNRPLSDIKPYKAGGAA